MALSDIKIHLIEHFTMRSTARRAYLAGSIGFIVIGLLHSVTHFLELSGAVLEQRFTELGLINVSQQTVSAWNLFQGTSLLMGFFSLAIGCGAIGALRAVGPTALPPLGICITNVVTLLLVMCVGATYLGSLQVWGGLFGILMFGVGVIAHCRRAA